MGHMSADAVDRYLDELLAALDGRAADIRRVLVEVDDHLTEAVRAGVEEGLDERAAAARAIERFGPPRVVARRFARPFSPGRELATQLVLAVLLLAGVGMTTVGVSGAVAAGMGAAFGQQFVSGDHAGVTYTPARCAEYRALEPGAATCEEAATRHHFGEVVQYRAAAGVVGLAALAASALVRRRRRQAILVRLLPEGLVPAVAAALFGVAAAALALDAVTPLLAGEGGAGASLSAAIVAAVAGAIGAGTFVRTLGVRAERQPAQSSM